MRKGHVRIHISRGIGMTNVSLEAPVDQRDATVEAAEKLLKAMPESTFQGDGVAITSIPGFGPRMDQP